jgi:hypothetical protein
MGGFYNVYTVNSSRTFYYRFSCGKCGKTTDWMPHTIEAEYSVRTKSSVDKVQWQLESGLKKTLNDHLDAIKRSTGNGYYFTPPPFFNAQYAYYLHGSCPHCGQVSKNKGATFRSIMACGLIGVLVGAIATIVWAVFDKTESFLPVVALSTAPILIGCTIGVLVGRKSNRNGIAHANVEYRWSGDRPFDHKPPPPPNNLVTAKPTVKEQAKEHQHDFRPVDDHRDRCAHCDVERYRIVLPCAWEKNYLKKILEWPENFRYAAPDRKYIAVNLPFDSNARGCLAAMDQKSSEPQISIPDFERFVWAGNGPDELAQQIDSLFRYFAHTHNPQLDGNYVNVFSCVHGLNNQLMMDCHNYLTHCIKRKPNNNTAAGLREGRQAQTEFEQRQQSLEKFSEALPENIYINLLHLLSVKRDVVYQMDYLNDDYKTVTGEYCSVDFGPLPAYCAEKLVERGSPPYSVAAYGEFPLLSAIPGISEDH